MDTNADDGNCGGCGIVCDPNESCVTGQCLDTTLDETAPGDIADLLVSGVTDTTVTITWTAPGDDGTTGTATSYDVRYLAGSTAIDDTNWATATEATGEPGPQLAGSGETFTVTGLIEGQEYYFAVKTCDEVPNCSGVSNTINATPEDMVAPAKVVDLRSPTNDDTSVTLEWTAPGDDDTIGTADHYDIRYLQGILTDVEFDAAWDTGIIDTNPPAPQVAGSTDTTTIGGLATGATYTFALKTYDEVPNESDISNVITLQVGVADTDPPEDTSDLAAAVVNETTVQLTWTAPAEDLGTGLNTATGYDIRYLEGTAVIDAANWATATEATGEPAPQAPGSAESFDVTGLTPDTQYYFALRTVDDQDNWSNVSNSPTDTPTDINPPENITSLAITAFDEVSISLSWTAPGDDGNVGTVTAYDIRYAEASIAGDTEWNAATQFGDLPTAPQNAGNSETMTIDTGLTQGHHYYIRMKTVDDKNNWSGMSNQVDQLLPCPACPVVSGIRPPAAPVGALVYLDGSLFGANQGAGSLTFGAQAASILSWSDTLIIASVPAGISGAVVANLTNDSGFNRSTSFRVTPYIEAIAPNEITLPSNITIIGSGFGSSMGSISFTGTSPAFTVTGWTDTQIDVDVTSNVLTGPVTITVSGYDSNTPLLTITGDERTWSSPVVVDPDATPSAFPRTASDNGDLQIVWNEKDPLAVDLEILGRARVGGTWNSLANISDTSDDSSFVEIAADDGGGFHLIWLESGATDIIRYSDGKDDIWDTSTVVAAEAMDARPAMGLLNSVGIVVAWSVGGVARYNTGSLSGTWGSAADVLTSGTNARSVGGAVDPAGNFHLVFVNGANLVHAWFDGSNWYNGGAIAAASPATLVSLAADNLGHLHALCWDTSLSYYHMDASGWTTGTAPSAAATDPEVLDLVVDAGDVLHAVLEDDSGSFYEILYSSKSPTGAWSAAYPLSDLAASADSKQPCLAASPDLTMQVVWSESGRIRMVFWE